MSITYCTHLLKIDFARRPNVSGNFTRRQRKNASLIARVSILESLA